VRFLADVRRFILVLRDFAERRIIDRHRERNVDVEVVYAERPSEL
jgi:hypothetical protein